MGREENPQDGLCSSQDMNQVLPEYNLKALMPENDYNVAVLLL